MEHISIINTLSLIDTISYQYLQKLLFAQLCGHRFLGLKAALQKRTGKREAKTVLDHMRRSDLTSSTAVWPGQLVRKGDLRRVYKRVVRSIYRIYCDKLNLNIISAFKRLFCKKAF